MWGLKTVSSLTLILLTTKHFASALTIQMEQDLDRRANPGSCYLIMTPAVTGLGDATQANEVVYSFKRGEYLMYIKYGEGDESRLSTYQTHNPIIITKDNTKIGSVKNMGKTLEQEIFGSKDKPRFNKDVAGFTSSFKDNNLEWHWITLGADLKTVETDIVEVRKVLFGSFDKVELLDATKRKAYVDEVTKTLTEVMKKSKHWKPV
ncbi:hypothetical protein K435DRAFT_877839 [Dendrothele bispora CBS 962.96]|uniref:Uncharacterized protein n=1 Tax=Dendrothele bispora (strain CBS 962.96) TaxID=1314807 RepID=A0A4S8KQ47_DENBC|nr:hypothetical protein K435DRAFT_877839 [Dendrothele bispora CBS 962.96]